jgi:hypothetical protein
MHDRLRVDGGDDVSRPQPHASSSAPAQAVVELAATPVTYQILPGREYLNTAVVAQPVRLAG